MAPIDIIFILILIGIAISIVNSVIAVRKKQKKFFIVNCVLYSIAALLIIFSVAWNFIINRDSANYDIKGADIFCEFYYDREEDDHYILLRSQFLSPPSEIAVPKSDIKIPLITGIYKPVTVYHDLNDNIVKIRPNYAVLYCIIGFIDFALLLLFNIGALIAVITKRGAIKGSAR